VSSGSELIGAGRFAGEGRVDLFEVDRIKGKRQDGGHGRMSGCDALL